MKGPHVLKIVDEQLRLKHQKFSFFPSSRLESSPPEPQSKISWWWPEKWLAVKVHLAGGGLELEPPSTTLHYLPPRRVRTLVPYFPASDDSGIMLSNTHRASEIQTNRGILANWQIEEQGVELPSLQMKNCKFIFCLSQVTFSFFLKLRFWRILCYGSSTSEQSETVITLHCTQLPVLPKQNIHL